MVEGQISPALSDPYSPGRRNLAREEALLALKAELAFQQVKHGFGEMFFNDDKLAILIEEVGEVGHAINEHMPPTELYKETDSSRSMRDSVGRAAEL